MRSMTTTHISVITMVAAQCETFWAFISPMSYFAKKVVCVLALVMRAIGVTADDLLEDALTWFLVKVVQELWSSVGSADRANKGCPWQSST